LLQAAYTAYGEGKWLDAAMLFNAYIDREPSRMINEAGRRDNVETCLQYAKDQVNKTFDDAVRCESNLSQCEDELNSCTLKYEGQSSRAVFLMMPTPTPPIPMSLLPVTPPSYPLVCRGGGSRPFTFAPYLIHTDASYPNPLLLIYFEKAPYQVGLRREFLGDLQPGQCSWLDRSIVPEEPDQILVTEPVFHLNDFFITWTNSGVYTLDPDYLNTMLDPEAYQIFDVYNNGPHFIVTRIQFCTPGPNEVALFANFDYESGSCRVKTVGDYVNPDQVELHDDSISSLQVGSNVRAYLCTDAGLTGLCETITMDDPNLSDNAIGGQISSVRVELIR
jgi:hypothetical protein